MGEVIEGLECGWRVRMRCETGATNGGALRAERLTL